MRTPIDIRDDLTDSLTHLRSILAKLRLNSVPGKPFNFSDAHKMSEGLLLSGWSHWEEFIHELLIVDCSTDVGGTLKKNITRFRSAGAPERLADHILSHPDSPNKFIEWNYSDVVARANRFLAPGHRYIAPLPKSVDLDFIKRMRNGIAHKSDKARDSFLKLARAAPFSLPPAQMRGVTVGRFIFSHRWPGTPATSPFILEVVLDVIENSARTLVP
ncbi:hypothetical protein OpiT1DRAFT_00777 [Opitutaceae bacterium TAV1]|nr:hypothetical protein OpiT1DRAFT_00777 [Opitutaceae bacterium TAV1]